MRATLMTPRTPGAIAIIQLDSHNDDDNNGDIGAALATLGIEPVAIGEHRLRDLCGIDRGIVVRWDARCAQLMPHGGPAVVDGLLTELGSRGFTIGTDSTGWPETHDRIEAMALSAIARAASPAAISRLLEQPARWQAWDGAAPTMAEIIAHSKILNRLIEPPVIVAIGRPNIGKSALINALSGRRVALVADEPGVTRDHVGVSLLLGEGADAIAVRWIDTPGIDRDGPRDDIDRAALGLAMETLKGADCVALCGDSDSGVVDPRSLPIPCQTPVIRVGLRDDLGPAPGAEVRTSALTGAGLGELALRLRAALVPAESMASTHPWLFDPALEA